MSFGALSYAFTGMLVVYVLPKTGLTAQVAWVLRRETGRSCAIQRSGSSRPHSELRRPAVSRREVLRELFQSLLYSEVVTSALSSFALYSLNISHSRPLITLLCSFPHPSSCYLFLTQSLRNLRANKRIGNVFFFFFFF